MNWQNRYKHFDSTRAPLPILFILQQYFSHPRWLTKLFPINHTYYIVQCLLHAIHFVYIYGPKANLLPQIVINMIVLHPKICVVHQWRCSKRSVVSLNFFVSHWDQNLNFIYFYFLFTDLFGDNIKCQTSLKGIVSSWMKVDRYSYNMSFIRLYVCSLLQ